MAEDTKKDQRVKAPVLRAKYKSRTLDEFIEKYSRDISRSGMWIKSAKPPALGTLLKVEILLEDSTPVISAVGRVVKRREEAEATAENPAGMGIRFLKIDEVSQPVIDRIVALKGEDAGPHFENIRTGATVPPTQGGTGESHSAFFGTTNPSKEMPPDADRTMMRQMNALLGEALRQVNESAPRKDAAPVPTQKATIMGVAAPAGMLEQALAVAREEGKKADEGPTKVATRSEIDNALEKLKTIEDPDARKAEPAKAEAPKAEPAKAEAPKAEAPKAEAPKAEPAKAEAPKAAPVRTPPVRSVTTKTASIPPPPSTRPIEVEAPKADEKPAEPVKAEEPAKVEEKPAEVAKVEEPAKTEEKPAEAAKVEEPAKTEEKPAETAKVEEPAKVEEKPAEAAKVEEPAKTEEKPAEAAKVEEPAKTEEKPAEAAKVEEPAKTEESAAEAAKVEEPAKVEESAAETAKAEEPAKVEESAAAEVVKTEEKKADAPKADEKKADEKKPEVKKADAPKHEEKKADEKPAEDQSSPMNMVITVAIIAALAFAVYWFLLRGGESAQHPAIDHGGAVSALVVRASSKG
ncbi:MAG: PilZ domain-containing protein [Polyangiales bacterium]